MGCAFICQDYNLYGLLTVWPTQSTGWLAGDLALEHKLVFSNHSDLFFLFSFLNPPSPDRKLRNFTPMKIFLFVKDKIVEMMIAPHKAADFTFIRKLM